MIKRRRNGYYRRPSSAAAWRVIDRLMTERGWYASAIASAAGVDPRMLQNALVLRRATGHAQDFGPLVSQRILEHDQPRTGTITVEPSRRRLQALAVMGWSLEAIASRTTLTRGTLAALRGNSRRKSTSVEVHDAVSELYGRLVRTPGPSEETAARARRRGWCGPIAWDDPDLLGQPPARSRGA